MVFDINITEDEKRALIYLGYSKKIVEAEILRKCSDFFENAISRAKQEHGKQIAMADIEPNTELPNE